MSTELDMEENATVAGDTSAADYFWTITATNAEEDSLPAELAWSATEEYPIERYRRRHWLLWMALVLVLCAVTGVAVWLGTVFYHEATAPHRAFPATPTVLVSPVPASPPPLASPAPALLPSGPPAKQEVPPAPDPDQQFLAQVAEIPGYRIIDAQQLITSTKIVCTELRNGVSPEEIIAATVQESHGISFTTAQSLFDVGTTIYCPDLARR